MEEVVGMCRLLSKFLVSMIRMFASAVKASSGTDCYHVVTFSESGEMSCWDTVDGNCLQLKKLTKGVYQHPGLSSSRLKPGEVMLLWFL